MIDVPTTAHRPTDHSPGTQFPLGVAALVLATQFCLGLNLFSVSPLLPLASADYGISNTTASLLVAGPVLLQAATGLPGSLVIGRWGVRTTLVAGSAMVVAAIAAALFTSYPAVLTIRLVGGAGAGLVLAGTGPTIKARFDQRHLPLMNSLFLVALTGGIAVGVALAAPIADSVGWENTLALFGAAMAVPMTAWVLAGIDVQAPRADRLLDTARLRFVLSDRTVAGLVISDALVFVQYAVLTTWLPTFLSEDRGMSLDRAGFVTGLLPAVGIVAVVVGGLISHRFRRWRPMLGIAGVLVGLSGFASFLLNNPAAIVVAVVILGIGTWVYQPAFHTVPMQLPWMTAENVAVVWGASMTIAGIGQFIAPIVVGASRDLFGTFIPGFAIWAVLAWSLPVVALLLDDEPASRTDEQTRTPEPPHHPRE